MLQIPQWTAYPWLRHGFTERAGGFSTVYKSGDLTLTAGDLNLGFTSQDTASTVAKNRDKIVHELAGDSPMRLITARQVHGTGVQMIEREHLPRTTTDGGATNEVDGLMTKDPGLLLGIQAADCVPVLVADLRHRAVAAFHAGWRGTVGRIVEHGIRTMQNQYGSEPQDLIAAVGPSIGTCCYAVGDEVQTRFQEAFSYASDLFQQHADATHLNLAEANRQQLLSAGLHPNRIVLTSLCTACTLLHGRLRFFSHRAEHGHTGRAMGLIGIQPTA